MLREGSARCATAKERVSLPGHVRCNLQYWPAILDVFPGSFQNPEAAWSSHNCCLLQMACTLLQKHIPGEGDIVRALAKIGCSFSYHQAPQDELQFPVRMLAVDLRDGIRLNKLIETITGKAPSSATCCTNANKSALQGRLVEHNFAFTFALLAFRNLRFVRKEHFKYSCILGPIITSCRIS